ncbi:MAG: hypothetical protein WC460_04210 [Patescibacteria group bacterium]
MEKEGLWRPYRVDALLPEAEELKNILGLKGLLHNCVLTPGDNERIVAAVNELEGTMFKVKHFSFTAPQSYVNPERCKASLLCTPGGNMLPGHSYERYGIRYICGLRHFVLVTTNCFRNKEDVVTEWEILFVTFEEESRCNHSINVVEQSYFLTMPTILRARYTLGERLKTPLPSYEQVLDEITKKVAGIKDGKAQAIFRKFAPAMAVTYIRAFGGEAEMPERNEAPEIIEEHHAQPAILADNTDNVSTTKVNPEIADMEAKAMSEDKKLRRRRHPKTENPAIEERVPAAA